MIVQAVQEKRAEEETRSNQLRLQAVIDLYQMPAATEHDLCTYALEKAISLSGSRMGFLAFVNEEESALSIHSWSRSALEVCKVKDRRSDYPLEKPACGVNLPGSDVQSLQMTIQAMSLEKGDTRKATPLSASSWVCRSSMGRGS